MFNKLVYELWDDKGFILLLLLSSPLIPLPLPLPPPPLDTQFINGLAEYQSFPGDEVIKISQVDEAYVLRGVDGKWGAAQKDLMMNFIRKERKKNKEN